MNCALQLPPHCVMVDELSRAVAKSDASALVRLCDLRVVNTDDKEPPRFSAGSRGLFHHSIAWAEAVFRSGILRSQLILLEARQAGSHYGSIALLLGTAVLLAIFGYFFLILCAVFALALLSDEHHAWIWILGGMAVLHIVAALVVALMAKTRLKTGLFEHTKIEFQKDGIWTSHPTPDSQH